jgi:hypothetical protein
MISTGRMNFVVQKIASVAPSFSAILYSFTGLLFWLPFFRKKPYLSLLHSLPLFFLPFLYMLLNSFRHKVTTHDYISNLFRIYSAGFIIYIIAIAFLLVIKWLLSTRFSFKHYKA